MPNAFKFCFQTQFYYSLTPYNVYKYIHSHLKFFNNYFNHFDFRDCTWSIQKIMRLCFAKKCITFKFKFFNLYFSSSQTLLLKQILLFVIQLLIFEFLRKEQLRNVYFVDWHWSKFGFLFQIREQFCPIKNLIFQAALY